MKKYLALLAICCAMPANSAIVTLNFTGSSYAFQGSGYDYQLTDFQRAYYQSFNSGVVYDFTFSYDTTAAAVGGKFPVTFSKTLVGGVDKTAGFTPYIAFAQAGAYTYMNVTLHKTETLYGGQQHSYAFFSIGDNDGDIVFGQLPTVTDLTKYDFVGASFEVYSGAHRSLYNSDARGVSIVLPEPGDVSAAVPEPASWAMMIGGFALLGAAMRRRTTVKAAFA